MKKKSSFVLEGVGFLVAQLVKNLPEMWETWILSLGWEDPLEKRSSPNLVLEYRMKQGKG